MGRRKPSGRSSLASARLDTPGPEALSELTGEHERTFSQRCRQLLQSGVKHYDPEEDDSAELIPWLSSADRTAEAVRVEPCVAKFVEAELEPRRVGIGRRSAHTPYSKSFGFRYQGRLHAVDPRLIPADPADLITLTLAAGYVAPVFTQAVSNHLRPCADTSVELIWYFWIARLLSDLPSDMMADEFLKPSTEQGTDLFCLGARNLGIKTFGRGSGVLGLRALGNLYFSAGMVLRMAQLLPLADDIPGWEQETNNWPWSG